MKKITFLFAFAATAAFAQQPGYDNTQQNQQTTNATSTQGVIERVDNGRQPIVDTYVDLTIFDQDVNSLCVDPTLTSEDMVGGPGAITPCGNLISSAGDGCFAAGELEEGFTAEASNGTDMIYIPAGSIGNTDDLVGASTFAEFTIIRFQNPTYAVGFDLWENNEPITEVRVFGEGDILLDTFNADTPINTQTFFGFIADELITKVELQGALDSGELFGNFLFGADCSPVIGIEEQALSQVSLYPNPASSKVAINIPASITLENITLTDVLGKTHRVQHTNGTIDVSSLSQGLYMVTIETSAGTLVQKLVKK